MQIEKTFNSNVFFTYKIAIIASVQSFFYAIFKITFVILSFFNFFKVLAILFLTYFNI